MSAPRLLRACVKTWVSEHDAQTRGAGIVRPHEAPTLRPLVSNSSGTFSCGDCSHVVTMPILMPVAEITGISKQLTILAFQFGDGLSNLCYPTMGALIAFLMYGKIPFNKWAKFIMKFLYIAWAACIVLLIVGSLIGY